MQTNHFMFLLYACALLCPPLVPFLAAYFHPNPRVVTHFTKRMLDQVVCMFSIIVVATVVLYLPGVAVAIYFAMLVDRVEKNIDSLEQD